MRTHKSVLLLLILTNEPVKQGYARAEVQPTLCIILITNTEREPIQYIHTKRKTMISHETLQFIFAKLTVKKLFYFLKLFALLLKWREKYYTVYIVRYFKRFNFSVLNFEYSFFTRPEKRVATLIKLSQLILF